VYLDLENKIIKASCDDGRMSVFEFYKKTRALWREGIRCGKQLPIIVSLVIITSRHEGKVDVQVYNDWQVGPELFALLHSGSLMIGTNRLDFPDFKKSAVEEKLKNPNIRMIRDE
jgi:hypothetical protein